MTTLHINLKSFWRGIRARNPRFVGKTRYKTVAHKVGYTLLLRRRIAWWLCLWTPSWHEGRGPYISLGLGFIAFYRGY